MAATPARNPAGAHLVDCNVTPSPGAAASISRKRRTMPGSAAFQSTATRERVGTASLSNSNRFALKSWPYHSPREVPARPGEGGDQPGADGIRHVDHHDRNRLGGLLGRQGRRCAHGHDHVDREMDQLSRQVGKALCFPLGIAPLNGEVLALAYPRSRSPCRRRSRVAEGG